MSRAWWMSLLLVSACDCGGELLGDPLLPPPDAGLADPDAGRGDAGFPPTDAGPPVDAGLFPTQTVIPVPGDRPIALAIGNLLPGAAPELALLACHGGELECQAGVGATRPFGETRLLVFSDLAAGGVPVSVAPLGSGLGILPAGLAIADLVPGGTEELALANSRRAACQARVCAPNEPCQCYRADPSQATSCPCEQSEVLVFGASAPNVMGLLDRLTMTGSNAVGLAAVRQRSPNGTPELNLLVAAQGRARHLQPCSRANRCLSAEPAECGPDPTACGCPVGERCECQGANCENSQTPGVCVAHDQLLDLVARRANLGELYNRFGCQRWVQHCRNDGDPNGSTSMCLDVERENQSLTRDGCNCRLPDRILLGDPDATNRPVAIAAGPFRDDQDWDVAVPSNAGIEFVASRAPEHTYRWFQSTLPFSTVAFALLADLDGDREGAGGRPDLAWYERGACETFSGLDQICPLERTVSNAIGCLGLYSTESAPSLFEQVPTAGNCRRLDLAMRPDGLCSGDFNRDGHQDLLLASRESQTVEIYFGDGEGSVAPEPIGVSLPGQGFGGPVACGDLDGDGWTDVAVGDLRSGQLLLLRSGP